MFKKLHVVLLCALVCGCGNRADTAAWVTDDLGDSIQVAPSANRIISLAPSITEVLFAIGAGSRVVGRTQWGDYPPEALDVESVGDGLRPNVEAIAALDPDLVVFYRSTANEHAVSQLGELGIRSISLRMDELQQVAHVARVLGRLTGDSIAADSIADSFEDALREASESARTATSRCSVAIIAWDNPPMIIGGGSFLTEILALAGSDNAFADVAAPSAEVSIEAIAARNPDRILTLGIEGIPDYARRPEWRVIEAVRKGRFVPAIGSQFARPTFRAVDAGLDLRAALGDCS